MSECPRCHQPVDPKAIACPHCRATLKAHGHPGIPLHRATASQYLCPSCVYHLDDTCNFPQRPQAKECTLYRDVDTKAAFTPALYKRGAGSTVSSWISRNMTLITLTGLAVVSIALALSRR